jgi:SAC3 family protein LENG8/THP3
MTGKDATYQPHYLSSPFTDTMLAPAYASVDARRNLQQPPPSSPPPVQRTTQKPDWPANMREYVQRAFADEAQIPGISADELKNKLKEVITAATVGGRLYDVSWETYPLPQQIIEQERALTGNGPAFGISSPGPYIDRQTMRSPSPFNRKRKSYDYPNHDDSTPPWRKANKVAKGRVFEDRVAYDNDKHANKQEKKHRKAQEQLGKGSSKFQADLEKRRRRFQNGNGEAQAWNNSPRDNSPAAPTGPVVGTSKSLEKKYFRLTAPPKPEEVRPQPILEQTFELLKKKWKAENNYNYICDQLKSMRQDLTVQHIKNSFTVEVYELHARIALEKGDMGEYNQCQTQLRALYTLNLGGHPSEFLAYRILYFIHTCNRTALNDLLADLTTQDKSQPAVKHALATRSSLALGNYHRFFRLYLDVPNLGVYLMDMFLGRERLAALANICKAGVPPFTTENWTDTDVQQISPQREYQILDRRTGF